MDPDLSNRAARARCTRAAIALACVRAVVRRGTRPRTVLDARCGDGLVARAIARRFPSARVVGQDVDRARIARARLAHAAARVRFEVSDSLDLPHFDLDVAITTIDLDVDVADAFVLLVSLRNALARDGLGVAVTHRTRATELAELAVSAGFSRVNRASSPRPSVLFELQR